MSSYVDLVDETICALITTPGHSGISVIRVSGPRALEVTSKFCTFLSKNPESHKVYFGNFRSLQGEVIDECLVTFFAAGKSYTGDETLEISVHGGFAASNRVLSELLAGGCRAAERGEFSFRAFYNGNIDLVQAEAVLSIINSRSDQARSVAIKQLKGITSKRFESLEEGLISVLAQLEASIDFSTEDIVPFATDKIESMVLEIKSEVDALLLGFKKGKIISQGLDVVLLGEPNVGKSSLYNVLLGRDKAIVSSTPGTTRDILESNYIDNGMPIRLIDSAGLRDSSDEVERLGITKTIQSAKDADLVFVVIDATRALSVDTILLSSLSGQLIFVVNKIDEVVNHEQFASSIRQQLESLLGSQNKLDVFFVSAKNGQGIQEVRDVLDKSSFVNIDSDEALITQHRHYDHLQKCSNHLSSALAIFKNGASYDLLALEVQFALKEVFSALGKELDEQVLDRVFKQFCIGK